MSSFRLEVDTLGQKQVPSEVYYGIFTARAKENFRISSQQICPNFIKMLAIVKKCASKANRELGFLEEEYADAIIKAANEVMEGKFLDHFSLDVFQAGAGTPWNMNINEVLANRANELLNHPLGKYFPVHPNDHVNLMQSSNDVIPNTIRLTAIDLLIDLDGALSRLEDKLIQKALEFREVKKSGRTHTRDAVPITLGQEMKAYSTMIGNHRNWIKKTGDILHELYLGGTAVGTGLNTHPEYPAMIIENLKQDTGFSLHISCDFIEKTQFMNDFQRVMDSLASLSSDLIKMNNDLMWMSSGPQTGLREIFLPAFEPGSSIMPGKINPSILESVNMVCFQVLGNRTSVENAVRSGAMDLNVYTPCIAFNLFTSIEWLKNAVENLRERCIEGIIANEEVTERFYRYSNAISTLLSPLIGYDEASRLAEEAEKTKKTIMEIAIAKGLVTENEMDRILEHATEPNLKIIQEIKEERKIDQET